MRAFKGDIANVYGGSSRKTKLHEPHEKHNARATHAVVEENHGGGGGGGHGEGEGTWIYSFCDLIMNLLMFFVMMFAISSVNKSKMAEVAAAITEYQSKGLAKMIKPDNSRASTESVKNRDLLKKIEALLSKVDLRLLSNDKLSKEQLEKVRKELEKLASEVKAELVLSSQENALSVVFASDKLFERGAADAPSEQAKGAHAKGANAKGAVASASSLGTSTRLSAEGRARLARLASELLETPSGLDVNVTSVVDPKDPVFAKDDLLALEVTARRASLVLAALKRGGLGRETDRLSASGLGLPVLQPKVDIPLKDRVVVRVSVIVSEDMVKNAIGALSGADGGAATSAPAPAPQRASGSSDGGARR